MIHKTTPAAGRLEFCCKAIQDYPRTGDFVQKLPGSAGKSKKNGPLAASQR
ncbi:hypothetical protein BRPE64_ACDS00200 [Caballeronia insecticola]|uniref:Uncharacterized protein n=1 Tax=Caballeronia insecticola TaxID=758793 RepID=R4WER9_9BURK|nr:hypothetical protein BRPE64_ACDS00200 [Caballeronia insecticola]